MTSTVMGFQESMRHALLKALPARLQVPPVLPENPDLDLAPRA